MNIKLYSVKACSVWLESAQRLTWLWNGERKTDVVSVSKLSKMLHYNREINSRDHIYVLYYIFSAKECPAHQHYTDCSKQCQQRCSSHLGVSSFITKYWPVLNRARGTLYKYNGSFTLLKTDMGTDLDLDSCHAQK